MATTHAPITLTSPLPAEDLFLDAMHIEEGLSQLGRMQLDLLSPKSSLSPADVLGKPVTVTMNLGDGSKRHFNGYITRFSLGTPKGRYFAYQADVRPWLWFLSRTSDCRIFQDMSVPGIVKKVFGDHAGVAHVKLKLFRSYRPWTYCVQYRESDLQFVTRLLEREGIYWYLEHSEGKHELVLMDSLSAHDPITGTSTLRYIEDPSTAPPDEEYVSRWRFSQEVKTGKTVLTSYDFERPATSLQVDASHTRAHDQASGERFDFQGDYIQTADGKQFAEDWLDEVQCRHHRVEGEGNAMGLEAGRTFTLSKHPRDDQNAQYLLTRVEIEGRTGVFDAGSMMTDGGSLYKARFEAIPASQQFRPPRRTPKPFVQGPQTAVVVGPGGEEIFTDKYGRVKVQFHWDRLGGKDEKSSCWVRVSQPWAGQNFGFVHIPRIGQEVVVSFLEGDPDQPLITGRVYNAQQMPPWDLPANATQSGVLTRSSKGGAYANANAIRFEDKKGSEELWIHAEKDQLTEVENDEVKWVGHDRKKTIDHDETVLVKHDRTETVDHDEKITIHHDRIERVDNDETIGIGRDRTMTIERDKTETVLRNKVVTVSANHTETIGATMSVSVGGSLSETVALNYAETVGAAMELSVGAALAITVGAAMAETVGGVKAENIGGAKTEVVGGNRSVTVAGDQSNSVSKNATDNVGKDHRVTVGGQQAISVTKEHMLNAKKVQLVAEDELSLKCGSAEITMKSNGDITIKGGKINIKGSGDVIIKGSKILGN